MLIFFLYSTRFYCKLLPILLISEKNLCYHLIVYNSYLNILKHEDLYFKFQVFALLFIFVISDQFLKCSGNNDEILHTKKEKKCRNTTFLWISKHKMFHWKCIQLIKHFHNMKKKRKWNLTTFTMYLASDLRCLSWYKAFTYIYIPCIDLR